MGEAAVPPELGESWGRPAPPQPLSPCCRCADAPLWWQERSERYLEGPHVPAGSSGTAGGREPPRCEVSPCPAPAWLGHSTPVGTSGC